MSLAISPTKPDHKQQKRPLYVAEAIKSRIVEQALLPGARLPTETELMQQFGMAKGTIREALCILEAQELIITRTGPGGGAFVNEVSEARTQALLSNYFYFRNLTIADIYQLRQVLEPEMVAALAGKLDSAQFAELEGIVAEYSTPAQSAEEEKHQHISALRFHAKLAEFCANPLLHFMIRFTASLLSDLTIYRRLYYPLNRKLWEKGKTYQLQLLDALRKGDSAEARRIMKEHMETAKRLMETQESVVGRPFRF